MRKALGKGLEALFPGVEKEEPLAGTSVLVTSIVSNPDQPRRLFEEEALSGLADSIRRHGLLQPLVVRRVAGGYELIAGERRLRAAILAGLREVPVVVRDTALQERLELALIENLQRENLTPLEEAEAYRRLIEEHGLTQEELGKRVGKSRSAVTNTLRLLSLPEGVKAQLESGALSAGHARAVLAVGGPGEQVQFAGEIVRRRLSKNEAERLAAQRRARVSKRANGAAGLDLETRGLVEELTRELGTKVRIVRRPRGGTLEIEFYSDAELDRLVQRLRTTNATAA